MNKTLEKWEEKTLEEICEKISAGGDKPEIFSETKTIECNIPIYSNGIKDNGLYGYTNNPTIEKPAITISARGTIGFICKRLEPYCPIVRLISLIPKDFIDLSFLAYAMNFIIPKNTGTSIPQLTVPNLKTSKIQYPSLSEQQRIVGILDKAFENIEKAKQNALQNLNNAKELFETMQHKLFTKNTDNWQMKKLPEIAINLDSKRIPITKNMRISGDIPYYGASGVVDYVKDYIFDDTLLLISEDGANLLMRTYPIAFSTSGKAWVNNHAHVLKFNDLITQKFVEYYLNSINLEQYITGAAQPKLNQTALNSIPIIYPPLTEQQKIVAQLDELQEQTKRLEQIYEQKIKDLDELKQSILQKAFNGEL